VTSINTSRYLGSVKSSWPASREIKLQVGDLSADGKAGPILELDISANISTRCVDNHESSLSVSWRSYISSKWLFRKLRGIAVRVRSPKEVIDNHVSKARTA
jgi:hypothetical protein